MKNETEILKLEELRELKALRDRAKSEMLAAQLKAYNFRFNATKPQVEAYKKATEIYEDLESQYASEAAKYNKARDEKYLSRIKELTQKIDEEVKWQTTLTPTGPITFPLSDPNKLPLMQERFFLRDQWKNGEDRI